MLMVLEQLCQHSSDEILYFFLSESMAETLESLGMQLIRHGLSRYLTQVDHQLIPVHFHRFDTLLSTLLCRKKQQRKTNKKQSTTYYYDILLPYYYYN